MAAPPRFDPYHKWLGIVANGQPLSHYRLLRIEPFESDREVIEHAYEKDLADLKQQEYGKHVEFVEPLTRELFAARQCLIDADKKATYDDELRKQLLAEAEAQREAKQQTQRLASEEAVRRATAGLTAELNQLRTLAEQASTRERQTLLVAHQLRRKLDKFDDEEAPSARLNVFSPFLFIDGLLARLAGEGNAIVHKAFRVAAILVSLFLVGGGLWWVISGPSRESASTLADVERVLVNSIGMKLAYIPAGEFLMGSPDTEEGRSSNEHQHRVRITKPFRLGVYEVTQAEYERVIGKNPSRFKGSGELPVESVDWFDAIRFCNHLSEIEELAPYYLLDNEAVEIQGGDGYRLPTEAEWEFSARGGLDRKVSSLKLTAEVYKLTGS